MLINCAGVGFPQSAGERPGADATAVIEIKKHSPGETLLAWSPYLFLVVGPVWTADGQAPRLVEGGITPPRVVERTKTPQYTDEARAQRVQGVDAPTLKEGGINLDIINWRSVVAPPGITPDQRKALIDVVDKMAKSKEWAEILKQKGWDDAYLSGDPEPQTPDDERDCVGQPDPLDRPDLALVDAGDADVAIDRTEPVDVVELSPDGAPVRKRLGLGHGHTGVVHLYFPNLSSQCWAMSCGASTGISPASKNPRSS